MPRDLAARVAALRQLLGAEASHLVNVGAGGEGAVACAGHDHRLDRIVPLVFGQRVVDLAHQREAQGVELFRPVQRDQGDAIEALGNNELVGHRSLSFPRRPARRNIVAERDCFVPADQVRGSSQ